MKLPFVLFFFQAEDGIRDYCVAGVQTCALTIFAAVSGSSPATVVAIGSIILPAMVRQGFPKRFGAGVIATSGALGILIPPSIVMVIYSRSEERRVGKEGRSRWSPYH